MRYFALLLVLPTLVLQAATTTSAGAVVVAGFEIDGNTPDDPAVTGIDWGSLPDATTHATDPVGNVDTSTFGQGSKEFDHPSTWVQKTGLAPNQDDISDVYFYNQTIGTQVYGYFGFRRLATSGTTNYDVEFNQAENTSANPARPLRTPDDLMVRFEQDGNSTFKLTFAYRWALASDFGDFPLGCIAVPGYSPAAGWCRVPTASAEFVGATGEAGHFAEGTLNLSSFFVGADCRGGFGTANVRSFTGESVESSLKDYVEPFPISVPPTCGSLLFLKKDQFGNPLGGATFRISPNPVPGVQDPDYLIISDIGDGRAADTNDTNDANTAPGTISVNPAEPGTYTVTEETPPPGYAKDPAQLTIIVTQAGMTTPVRTFKDYRYFPPLSIDNTADATKAVAYDWDIAKTVVGADTKDVPEGTTATFDYRVTLTAEGPPRFSGHEVHGAVTITNPDTNTGFSMVATLAVTGAGGAACAVQGATDVDDNAANGLQVTVPTTDLTLGYTCPPGSGPGDTTATITWDSGTYPQNPAVFPNPVYTAADTDGYTFEIPAANRTDETVNVTDLFNSLAVPGAPTESGPLGTVTWDPAWDNGAFPRTVGTYEYSRTVTGVPGTCRTYDNTATATANDTGAVDNAGESVTVCVGKDLDVTKTADLGYQRELLWRIAKGGPGTVFTGADADGKLQRMVRYTIDITADGMADSAWALTGTIKLDNPNAWDVTGTISDTVVVDGRTLTCVINEGADAQPGVPGQQVTVLAGAVDQPLSYTCPGVQQGDYVGNNTVTFDYSADSHEYPDADDTVSRTQGVAVTGDPTPTNATVTITDLLDGKNVTATLPQRTFVWTTVNGMTGHTQRIDYDVLLGTTEDACTPHRNVVTIDQTEQTDDHTVTVCSPGLTKSVVADYGLKQPWDLTKVVDKTFVEVGPDGEATFNYTVTATPGQVVPDGSSSWTGVVGVHNPSTTEPLTISLKDTPDVPGWTGCAFTGNTTDIELAPGASANVPYTCTGTGFASGTNKATATFDGQSVNETVDVNFTARPGITDSTTTLTDDIPNDGLPALRFAVDASKGANVFPYARKLGAAAGACETYTNTAVLALTGDDLQAQRTVRVCEEAPITVDVSGGGSYGVTYPWTIEKVLEEPRTVEVDAATGEATFDYEVIVRAGQRQPAGWTLSGTVTVTNPNTYDEGAITLTEANIGTNLGGGASCSATLPGTPIASGGSVVMAFSCTFAGPDAPNTSGTVTADVSWDPAGDATSDTESDTSGVSLTVGKEIDKVIDVWDDKTDPENPVLLSGEDGLTWSAGLVRTYPYTLTHQGAAGKCNSFTNLAWLDLAGENDPDDSTTATVCVEKPLGAEVSASGSLAKAYAWSVQKSVDATTRTVDASGTATFRYTVTARAGAMTESGWTMGGQVTVSNPNTYEDGDITADVAVTSDLGGGVSCTVTGGQDVLIPEVGEGEDGTVTLPFTCTFSAQPAGSGTVTTTVTWDPAGEGSSASATDSAPVSLAVGSETNKTVQVVDDKTVPGQRIVLDPALTWSAGLVKAYTYDLAVAGGAAGSCRSHTNTATIDQPVGTDPTATAVVLACTPAPPEVLPVQAFGKAGGSVKATCQGTVRSRLDNRSGVSVTYQLRVGKKVHQIVVRSLSQKRFTTTGKARAKVVLKVDGRTLDRVRIPARCLPPEVLPDTGLRAFEARLALITRRWRF